MSGTGTELPVAAPSDEGKAERSARGSAAEAVTRRVHRPGPARWWDAVAVAFLGTAALLVTSSLWADPRDRYVMVNAKDQAFFEWMLAHGARVVAHGEYPFVSTRMGYPEGVNAMANTSILGLSLPLSPVTLIFGASVSFVLLLTLAFAVTGISWYFLLSRRLTGSPALALLGAAVAAFAPNILVHGNGHPNIVFQFLVPWLIWATLRLAEPGRAVRNGVLLGLLVTWQAFINEEVLLFTALGIGLYLAVLALLRRDVRARVRPFLAGLGVAGLVATALLAYPLSVQFFGPQAYHGISLDFDQFGNDVVSFLAFSRDSVGGSIFGPTNLAPNLTEENTFFGLPLMVLLVALVWWLRRDARVLALAAVGGVFALSSLGPVIEVKGHRVGPGPWAVLGKLPILVDVVPTRLSLAVTPVIVFLLVLAGNRVRELAADSSAQVGAALRWGFATVLAVAMLPLLPTPLHTAERQPTPRFLTAGTWRQYVTDDSQSIMFTPPASNIDPLGLMWAADIGLDARITHGYFLVPDPSTGKARFDPPRRPTADLLYQVSLTGTAPFVTDEDRRLAREDLRHWRTAVVVQMPVRHPDAVRATTTALLGIEPTLVDGAWVWDVRPLTAG